MGSCRSRPPITLNYLAVTGIAFYLALPAVSASSPNALNSGINDALITRASMLLAGAVPKKDAGVLRDECAGAMEWYQGKPDDRILVSDLVLSGPTAAKVASGLQFGGACRVSARPHTGRELSVEADATFRDFWGAFRIANSARAPWTLENGHTVSVWMMKDAFSVSGADWHGDHVIATPFHDTRFAIVMVTGANVTSDAKSYFDSVAFLNRQGFRLEQLTLSMPRLNLSRSRSYTLAESTPVVVRQRLTFSLDEEGAGDSPVLPRGLGKLLDTNLNIGTRLVYTKYSKNYRTGTLAIDHPFYFAIVDTQTQARLFEAFVADPRAN